MSVEDEFVEVGGLLGGQPANLVDAGHRGYLTLPSSPAIGIRPSRPFASPCPSSLVSTPRPTASVDSGLADSIRRSVSTAYYAMFHALAASTLGCAHTAGWTTAMPDVT